MNQWYKIFSYWGFALWLFPVVSPTLILFLNLLFSIILLLTKYKTIFDPVVLFILVTHAIPAWSARHGPLDFVGSFIIFTLYLLSLRLQGTSAMAVYKDIIDRPPETIREYLKRRGLL
jgi:hypothetical protein